MKKFLSGYLILFAFFANAQEFHIKGKVLDLVSKAPLEATTIYAETVKDSVLIGYTISDPKGDFLLEGRTSHQDVNLYFSFNGYKTLLMKLALKRANDLGEVLMEEQATELQGVQVIADRVPIKIKKDTLEFNADSFKTRPDATVEDVLKKLPGVEVASDGKITVNGKEVSQVLVNGQVFFSNDPTVATKSLPKEIISKIQILDTKTRTQQFTGDSGTSDTKTINLTIKEDKNKGHMGRISVGYGTDERYQGNGLLNYFNDTERISFLAGSNNINNAGFSINEIFEMVGNPRGGISVNSQGGFSVGNLSFGFGDGIVTSSNLGASYANQKKDKYRVGGNYFLAYSDSYNNERTSRENILADRRFFTDSETDFSGITNSNQGSVELEFDIDPTLRITIEPSLSVNRTNSLNRRNTVSTDVDGEVINSNETATVEDGMQRNFSNRMEILKKLDTLGKYIRLSFRNKNLESNNSSNLSSYRAVFGDDPGEELLDQLAAVDNKEDEYSLEMTYRQPLAKKLYLDLGYEYRNNQRENSKQVFDYEDASGNYTGFNEAQSSDFRFRNRQQLPSLGLRLDGEKTSFNIKAEYANTDLANQDFQRGTSFEKKYNNILPSMRIRHRMGNNTSASINYDTRLAMPAISQLQELVDVGNPLNITIGNPDLKPTLTRSIHLNFDDYNWKERSGLFVYAGLQFDEDRVVSVTETDENLIRTTRYTNIDGNYNHYGGLGYSKEIKKDSTFSVRFSINPYLNVQKSIGFNNGQRLETKRTNISPRISTAFNYKELIGIEPEYGIVFGSASYNLAGMDNVDYVSHNAKLRTTTYWPKNLIWGNDVTYSYNGNVGPGFDKDAIFWNMSLGVELFKKSTNLKVLAYDLLNQNINTRRTTGDDYIQDFQGTVLQRFFMLNLTNKFDQFGGVKGGGGPRGGRGVMIRR